MSGSCVPDELVRHISNISALTPQDAEKLAIEVMHYFSVSVEDYVVQRHQELQRTGLPNSMIYPMIESEVTQRVFSATPITIRQIRRLVYG